MNKQDFIDKGWVLGTRLRKSGWPDDEWVQILFMGDKKFFGMLNNGVECSWDYDEWNGYDSGWQEYKEPEVKMKTLRELQDELNQLNYEALNKLRSDGIWEERKEPKYGTAPVEGIRWDTEHVKKSLHALHLQQAFCGISPKELDLILDWLGDYDYLCEKGIEFKRSFWELFIRSSDHAKHNNMA